jgi:sulfide:quinone oxidoreductase
LPSKILIAGSGPGALEATLALAECGYLDPEISLISPQTTFHYRPNLVMEPFGVSQTASYNVGEIIRHPRVQQWEGTLERVDAAAGKAWSPEGDEFSFDALIVATGTKPKIDLPAPAITLGAPGSLDALKDVAAEIDAGAVRNVLFTIADAPSWQIPLYEFALMSAARAEQQSGQQIAIAVVTPEGLPLESLGVENSATVARLCNELGVVVRTGLTVATYDGETAVLSDGEHVAVDRLFAIPGLSAVVPEGLPLDAAGFIPVDEHQLVVGTDNVYAVGDVTNFRVKQGGLASAEADAAVEAIEASLGTRESAEPFNREIHAILLSHERRVPLKAKIGDLSSESLPAEPLDGPAQKIHSRLLSERLRDISPR